TAIEAANVSLRYEDERTGRAWTADGGRLEVTRDGDEIRLRGDFALIGARDYATTLEMNYTGRLGTAASEVGLSFDDMPARDIAGQSPALAWLDAIDAPISGALRASLDAEGRLGPLNATLQIGAGAVRPNDATAPITFRSVRSYFTYDPSEQRISFSELSIDSKWVKTSVAGQAYLVGVENGLPSEILLQARLSEIEANPMDLYEVPVVLEGARMDMRLQLDPFVLSLGELSLNDQGDVLRLRGEARAEPDGWDVALDGHMGQIAPDRLMQLWPERLEEKTRDWILENIRAADLRNIQLALRSVPDSRPDFFLGFDFENFSTQFIKNFPVIEAAHGHASLMENRFVVSALGGYVTAPQGGRVDIAGTSFDIPDVSVKRTPAQVNLRTRSTITAALSLLDEPPLEFLTKAGRDVTLADGVAELGGTLDLRLLDKLTVRDVAFDIAGTLRDVRSETLVPGRVLSAAELDVQLAGDALTVAGAGRLGQLPFDGRFETDIGPEGGTSTVRGWIELSERFTEEFGIDLPPGSVSGSGRAEMEIDFRKGTPGEFRLRSDLAGVGLRVPQLDWALSQGGTGRLEASGRLGAPPSIDRLQISGAGLNARGTVSLRADGQLDRASFTSVQVGDWISAPVELVGRGAGVTPAVRVLGGSVDLRQTSLAGDGGGGGTAPRARQGGPVSLRLDRLQISDGIALTDFRAELDMSRGADGSFTGRVNGQAPITGRVVPQGGRSAFRLQAEDAAGVLVSAGLIKGARNGKLDVTLVPGKGPGVYEGRLKATGNMRLKDAPSMAALLNALTVVGLLEQLGGEGIHFETLEARFQLSPERVTVYSSSAVGAAMGITMDGYYFLESGQMDMQGVISPVYVVNAVGELFTRRGEGLFGFNYTLKGSAKNPRVGVNPLSAFTPGMFRELFRRPPPKLPQERRQAPATQQGGAAPQAGAPRTSPDRNSRVPDFNNREAGR
ncbi:MAG: AsmA-like C-terminal region-containing protein, partial [Roseovarius sp.]